MEELLNILPLSPFIILVKIPLLVLLLLYIAFTFIVNRQTHIMSKIVEIDVSGLVQLITLIHFLLSIALFLFVLFFL